MAIWRSTRHAGQRIGGDPTARPEYVNGRCRLTAGTQHRDEDSRGLAAAERHAEARVVFARGCAEPCGGTAAVLRVAATPLASSVWRAR